MSSTTKCLSAICFPNTCALCSIEGCKQWKIATIALAVAIVLAAVIICSLIIIIIIWLVCKKNSGKKMMTQSNGEQDVVRYNKTEEVVDTQREVNHNGDTENMTEIQNRSGSGTVDNLSNQNNDSSTTTTSGESGQHSGATPGPDMENESSETDSIGEEDVFSSSPPKKWLQNGRRPSMSGGRRRSSSTSSYRRGSDPEGKNLIKKLREGRPTQS